MHKNFMKALAWNSSFTFLYKIILSLHQIALYSAMNPTLYGVQSTLFAIIYITMTLTNFGFEEMLLPFFSTLRQSKKQFHQVLYHIITRIIGIALITALSYFIITNYQGQGLHKIQLYCNKNIFLLISIIFFVESIKKSLIVIMQLAFLTEEIAYAEIATLSGYIATVWSLYGYYKNIALNTIFTPMLIASTVELCYLTYHFIKFYTKLPSSQISPKIPFKGILKQRFYNYINQLAKTIYSPNSMTIGFAYVVGFQQAATIKFFTNIISLLYTCISKSIGITSGATLSAINNMPIEQTRSFFKDITYRYIQFLLIISLLLMIVVGYAWHMCFITNVMALHITMFFTISFLEYVSLTYEQLFISHHAALSLATINIVNLGCIALTLYNYLSYTINQATLIILLIIIKVTSLTIIMALSNSYWGISIRKVNKKSI